MSSRRLALALLIVTAFAALAIARPQQREAASEVPPCDPRMERPCFEGGAYPRAILAVFDVQGEKFTAHVVNPSTIQEIYCQVQCASPVRQFPIASLHKGTGYNAGYSWHTDPEDIDMVEAAIEVCDGLPSHVEENLDYWLRLGTYCPWSAQVFEIIPLPDNADADADGCPDLAELGDDPVSGGARDIFDEWDFFDVTADGAIDLTDTLSVLAYFGDDGGSPEGNARDRYIADQGAPWRTAEANDGVTIVDALASLGSFGHRCAMPP